MSKSELAVWVPPPGASRQAHAAGGRQRSEQLRLFNEFIETIVVRDQPFVARDGAWGTRTTRPSGDGGPLLITEMKSGPGGSAPSRTGVGAHMMTAAQIAELLGGDVQADRCCAPDPDTAPVIAACR